MRLILSILSAILLALGLHKLAEKWEPLSRDLKNRDEAERKKPPGV